MKKNLLINLFLILVFAISTNVIAQDHLLLSEIVVTPTAGEYVEIYNPTASSIDLTDYYLTDGTFSGGSVYYYKIVTGVDAGGGGFGDWHARFPTGASIGAGELQTISINGSMGFLATYAQLPTYELFEDDSTADAVPDMLEALPGSINGQGGLTNSGEAVILYSWNGLSDLVTDIDYAVWGDKVEAVDKTGISIDGPDADTLTSTYLDDTAIALQEVVASGAHPGGSSFSRITVMEMEATGGNGITGHDETSELATTTWMNDVVSPNSRRLTIAAAIEDLNGDFVPDALGQTVTVEGVVFSPNFQTFNNEYYIWDEVSGPGPETSGAINFGGAISRGTNIFMFGGPFFNWQPGDMLEITGVVDQFNGKTEIIPADTSGWVLVSSGNPEPNFIELTLAEYKADPEAYEGSLLGFVSLTLVGGTWPTTSSTNLDFSDGIDTLSFRIDSDTDIPGQPEPTWPQDIIGIGSQFDSSTPPDGGYQIFPRFFADDFLDPGTIPVELTSFTVSVNENNVTLNWITVTEVNNRGFDVLRSTVEDVWETIGFVAGFGTTTKTQYYSFVDDNLASGKYAYRLKQFDFDGTVELLNVVNVEVTTPVKYNLSQNYPNPFNPSTAIKFTLAKSGNVTLKIYNTLGEEVALLVNQVMESGNHEVNFDAFSLGSGIYFYRIEAGDFSQVKKMTLLK